jgi:hypothetical protein
MEGVEKWRIVVLAAPLGQVESNVQGHCHIVAASSSMPKLRTLTTSRLA